MKKRVNKLPFATGGVLFVLGCIYLYLVKVSDRFGVDGVIFVLIIMVFALLLISIGLLPRIEKFLMKDATEAQKEATKKPVKGWELVFVILGAGLMFFLLSARYFFPNSDFVQTYLNGIGGAIVLGVFFGLIYLPIYIHKSTSWGRTSHSQVFRRLKATRGSVPAFHTFLNRTNRGFGKP